MKTSWGAKGMCCLIAVAIFSLGNATSQTNDKGKSKATELGKPLNEEATSAAWNSYNAGKFEVAITNADVCIEEFRGHALLLESRLESEKADLPSGETTEEIKKKILANGILNDVATCYFIKGRSAEKLGRKDAAIKAYKEASKLRHARVWDPKGWFWSPAEAAEGRIEGLK